jgi:hypothetical protein
MPGGVQNSPATNEYKASPQAYGITKVACAYKSILWQYVAPGGGYAIGFC